MRARNLIAISILLVLIGGLAFLQTPIMARARARTWSTVVGLVAKTTGTTIDSAGLEDQLEHLQAENLRLKSELKSYNNLRTQLGTVPFDQLRAIPAAIVGRPIDTFHARYIINQGFGDGVVLGAPVVIRGSTLVGFVREISEHTATIELLFHPSTQLTVEAVHEDQYIENARGLLESRYYTSLFLTTVPRDQEIIEGQGVVTTQKGNEIPQGLLIGTIEKVMTTEYDAYRQARLSLPYDPDTIDAVQVLVAP